MFIMIRVVDPDICIYIERERDTVNQLSFALYVICICGRLHIAYCLLPIVYCLLDKLDG